MGRVKTNEDVLYYVGIALLVTAGLVIFVLEFFDLELWPCMIHVTTGFYCPGCGGTRAVTYMLTGHFLKSLYYQPAILPGTVVFLIFMITHTIERIFPRGKIKGIKFRMIYVYVFLGLLVLNVILKNIFGMV